MRDHNNDTITITTDIDLDDYCVNTIDISTISTSTITTGIDDWISTDDFSITLSEPIEFEDHMPNVEKVEDMCNDYPALRQAYEKFKTIYAMVHQDWQGRQEEDDCPF